MSAEPETRSRADYMRDYRARRPELAARHNARTKARTAAALAVAKLHPDEFAAAIAREERKRGLR